MTVFLRMSKVGILATADKNGMVNAAIYGRPHFFDENRGFYSGGKSGPRQFALQPPCRLSFKEADKYEGKAFVSDKNS